MPLARTDMNHAACSNGRKDAACSNGRKDGALGSTLMITSFDQWEAEHTLRFHSTERGYIETIEALKTKLREHERQLQLNHVQKRDLLQQNMDISTAFHNATHMSTANLNTSTGSQQSKNAADMNRSRVLSSAGVQQAIAPADEPTPPRSESSELAAPSERSVVSAMSLATAPTAFEGTAARSPFEAAATIFADRDAIFPAPAAESTQMRKPQWQNFRGGTDSLKLLHSRLQAASYNVGVPPSVRQ